MSKSNYLWIVASAILFAYFCAEQFRQAHNTPQVVSLHVKTLNSLFHNCAVTEYDESRDELKFECRSFVVTYSASLEEVNAALDEYGKDLKKSHGR